MWLFRREGKLVVVYLTVEREKKIKKRGRRLRKHLTISSFWVENSIAEWFESSIATSLFLISMTVTLMQSKSAP